MTILRAGCYGKIRAHGDFIRHHADALNAFGLEQWIDTGFQHCQRTVPGGYDGAQRRLRPTRFLFAPAEFDTALLGVMVPSGDKVGRRFPLTVFAPCEAADDIATLPVAAQTFFDQAEGVADMGDRGIDLDALRGQIDSLRVFCTPEEARQRLDAFCADVPLRDIATVLTESTDPEAMLHWISNVTSALSVDVVPEYVVQCHAAAEGLWIGAMLRVLTALGPTQRPRLIMWDRGAAPGDASVYVRLLYDDTRGRYFIPMLFADLENEYGWNVTPRDGEGVPVSDETRNLYGPLVAEPNISVAGFAARVGSMV